MNCSNNKSRNFFSNNNSCGSCGFSDNNSRGNYSPCANNSYNNCNSSGNNNFSGNCAGVCANNDSSCNVLEKICIIPNIILGIM